MINKSFVQDVFNEKNYIETKTLVELFLNEDLNYLEIYEKTHIPIDRIKSRLTNYFLLEKLYGDKSKEIYDSIKKKMQIINNNNISNGKLRIDLFYKKLEDQKKFLIHLALTFRATFKTIEELFNIPLDGLIAQNDDYYYLKAFNYLNIELLDQEEVKKEILSYYNEYLEAYKKKDIEKIRSLIRKVTDYDIKEFKVNHVIGSNFTEDELITLVKYQLKYGLSNKKISEIFHLDDARYSRNVLTVLDKEPYKNLKVRFERLMEYNISINARKSR